MSQPWNLNNPETLRPITPIPLQCIHEGPIVSVCPCGGEDKHLRQCLHPSPSADRDLCSRVFAEEKAQSCAACPDRQTTANSA